MLKSFLIAAALILPALIMPASARAELRQHGNTVFTLPEGWYTGRREENGTLIILPRLKEDECEFCRVWIARSQVKTGAPERLLARNLRLFLDADEPDPELIGEVSVSQEGRHKVAMQALKSGRDVQILLAVEIADRTEFYGFEADSRDEQKIAESLEVFARDIVPMILTARYLTEGVRPVLGPPIPGGVSGVWQGTGTRWSLGIDMMMKMDLVSELFVFWEDGTFYDGTPPTGIAPFDRVAALRSGDMSFGNYRIEGGRLILSYADGQSDARKLGQGGIAQGFDCTDSATCNMVKPMPDGTKINGRIESFIHTGFSPNSGLSGGTTFSSTLYYAPDGRWSYDSFGGASVSFETGGYAGGSTTAKSGRYRVANGTVIRSFDDGSPDVVQMIFQDSSGTVMIGGDFLKTGP
ncbi:hypothetical protein [Pseudogemmobacter bohemicus]|uniref:hypothetical protein n=1 Tax=Pseudogemmobacter bohemicus TaxID=2250708 RepID=UPI001300820D|nr:hypothetical protein [Pseudogemmobacter bohemicus]